MQKPSEERRGFIRVPFDTKAKVTAGGKTVESRNGIDISMSGLCIECERQAGFSVGASCEVSIRLSAADEQAIIEAKGTIVRSDDTCLGINFTEIDLDSYHHLRQLILHNTTDPERAEQEFHSHWGIRPIGRAKRD